MFPLKGLGELNYFLGIEMKKVTEGFNLSQRKYINNLLKKVKMDNANPLPMSMIGGFQCSYKKGDRIENAHEYRSVVGALQYITITRPEIYFSVNKVCQYMEKPMDTQWKVVKRILKHLKGTTDQGIIFKRSDTQSHFLF